MSTATATATRLRPVQDRVVVKPLEQKEEKVGGIIIPDTAKEKPQEGEVVAVGPGKLLDNGQRVAPSVKAGDKVMFGKYSGTEVKIGTDNLLIMHEDDILAIVEN